MTETSVIPATTAVTAAPDLGGLLRQLLNNDYIPKEIREDWWITTSDDLILSFHDKDDIKWLMNQIDLLELRTIRSLPGHEYDIETVRKLNQIKIILFARLNRSKNGGERNAQITNISSEVITQGKPQGTEGTGFFSSVKKLVTGGE
ncbi:MAG: hypothetical protein C3F06_02430 [Candidatus Methanoperedenaceae archaeon]|nr:MAG: hypothetical protein C3F06_02430 [Candidatus Methanoperedenaceae archaeon]